MNNPFFTDYKLPYDAVPFDKFKTENFIPAVEKSIELTMDRINKIVNNTPPNFPFKPEFLSSFSYHEIRLPISLTG